MASPGMRHVFEEMRVYFFNRAIMSLLSRESRVVCSAGIADDLEGIDKRESPPFQVYAFGELPSRDAKRSKCCNA